VVDVELLCRVPGGTNVECGDDYGGYCGLDRLIGGFTWSPLPPPPPTLGFLDSIAGQATMGIAGVVVLAAAIIGIAVAVDQKERPREEVLTDELLVGCSDTAMDTPRWSGPKDDVVL
jgi:hypothetical protein